MGYLKYVVASEALCGEASRPDQALVLEGAPEFTNWQCLGGAIQAGIWSATPGMHRVIRDSGIIEQFYLLEGEIEITEDGSDTPRRFSAGDLVAIEPGFRGTWRTITPVRKIYFTATVGPESKRIHCADTGEQS